MSIRDVIYVTRAVLPHLRARNITGLTIGASTETSRRESGAAGRAGTIGVRSSQEKNFNLWPPLFSTN